MNEQSVALLKSKIDQAKLVSFDVFDTLLFRKTNTPETVFDLVGKHFGIHGFRKLRMDEQNEASRRAYLAEQHPHANMDEIYEVLAEHTEIPVDWMEVKEYEMQLERDALVANQELLEIFRYAKAQGKRVVATSDMYLSAQFLQEVLQARGFGEIDHVYCSADEHKAKFNRDLFEVVAQKENLPYEDILHIGDKERDDGEYPGSYGMQTFVYYRDAELEKVKNAPSSDVDKGLYKILHDSKKGFWYNLGVEVGGPIYMGLYRFLRQQINNSGQKIYFLSRDGYNLYHIFKDQGFENIEYLYTSRRALTLACIREMNEEDIRTLPPYTYGQTVGEILDYLCIDRSKIRHLAQAGFSSFEDVIRTEEDKDAFRTLYRYDKDVFLERCALERENALRYLNSIGFLEQDAVCFDCGWQGSSQDLIERFKRAVGCHKDHFFVYFGIKNGEKSRIQLHGRRYTTYLFDFYKNYSLQADIERNVVMYELFFSAPHESVYYYGADATVVFEQGDGDQEKAQMLEGIRDFMREGLDFVAKYDVEYTPEISVGHLSRLIHLPTEEEAIMIGNLSNVDGFVRKQGDAKHIAFVTRELLAANPNREIYWPDGLLTRPDIPEELKKECAVKMGVAYPKAVPIYHLEDEQNIRNYHRWLEHQEQEQIPTEELKYKPSFSVVIPVYNTVTEQLEECFDSVLAQTYDNFELILVDDHSSWDNVVPVLQRYEAHEKVQVIYRPVNGHISVATNDGISRAAGDFIVFMDCDDTIEPHALYEFARKLNENPELDFIYSDEDKITEDGKIRHMPFFKPEWSPDLFLSMMYTNHLATYRASIVKAVGGLRTAFNGSQDYDFTLRFMERSDNKRVGHVSKILYHWRERKESVAFAMTSKNYAAEAARHAKEDYIRRSGLKAHLEYITGMSQYRMVYEVVGAPLVSIIIPSKDHPQILRQCVDSIRTFTQYSNYEIVVVDNGSSQENKVVIGAYLERVGARYIYDKAEFNFSKMCNTGAAQAKGDYLLFLNDDIEIFQSDWLERMLGHAQQKHTGAVGAKLFYPLSTKLQHVGVSNPHNGPLHSFWQWDDQNPCYFGWNRVDHDCIAVTGACLMVDARKFREVDGFDEGLPVAYNDVKLCFALHKAGYYNVMRTDVAAYHHESLSRGSDQIDDQKLIRMNRERTGLFAAFPELNGADPFMNPNLEQLSNGLAMKIWYDRFTQLDLSGCQPGGIAAIDSVEVTDRIRILGWSVLEGERPMEDTERYLVFRDPFERVYGAKALPMSRPDVAAHFGNPSYEKAGFECMLHSGDLRVDLMPYQIGVMTVAGDGTRHLVWSGVSTNVIRKPGSRPVAAACRKAEDAQLHLEHSDIQYYLDACQYESPYYAIRGFAFCRGGGHYRYSKSLLLLDGKGGAWEVDVQPEERVDVACAFPKEHFLYYTGFVCYLFDGAISAGQEYDVVIRMRNRFDPTDVRDVVTDGKVIL